MTDSQRPRASRAACLMPSVCVDVFQISQMLTTESLFRMLFFVPRNEAVSASLFQVVVGGSGGAMRQSGVTWWLRPYARQRAEVNKDLTSVKSQAKLQVSIHLSTPKQEITKVFNEIKNFFISCKLKPLILIKVGESLKLDSEDHRGTRNSYARRPKLVRQRRFLYDSVAFYRKAPSTPGAIWTCDK